MTILHHSAQIVVPDSERGRYLRNAAAAPFVFGRIVPIALLDGAVSLYQAVCFRLWGIPQANRSRHVVIDRYKLPYRTGIQKLNCVYCGYANGVLAYAREVASRTEAYWCPIKHHIEPVNPHRRYRSFAAYGKPDEFSRRLHAGRGNSALMRLQAEGAPPG